MNNGVTIMKHRLPEQEEFKTEKGSMRWHLFSILIDRCQHEDKTLYSGIRLTKYQFLTSSEKLKEYTGWGSRATVRKYLEQLEDIGLIRQEVINGKFRTITILKYREWFGDKITRSNSDHHPVKSCPPTRSELDQQPGQTLTTKNNTIEEYTLKYYAAENQFWTEYPRKLGSKQQAIDAYREQIANGATDARIMQALRIAKDGQNWNKEGGRYIPNPVKWLESEAWRNVGTTTEGTKKCIDY